MENLILYKSPYEKTRVGKNNDGGYIITELPGDYDIFLSGGVSDDISFENDILLKYHNLVCYAFDGTISKFTIENERIIFINKNLGNENSDYVTNLHEYMKNYNNIFMKMDIEGHEFKIFPTFFENNYIKKIKQLVIEIHSPRDIEIHPDYYKGLSNIKNEHMFELFKNINKTHILIHFHANNGTQMNNINGIDIPHVFELTYIRNDFIKEYIRNDQPLPTHLDMPNITYMNDVTLKGFPYSV